MAKKTVADVDVRGKRVLMRVDRSHRVRHLREAIHDRLPFGKLAVGADAKRERAFDALECIGRLHQDAERNGAGGATTGDAQIGCAIPRRTFSR